MKPDLRNFTIDELIALIVSMGEKPHRAKQIFRWLYAKGADSFREMTDLPKSLIERLEREVRINALRCEERLVSRDGTEKFLWELVDGEFVESVLIKVAGAAGRRTLCLSTQVGCKFKCPFCASGTNGFKRNLAAFEILGQIVEAERLAPGRVGNIVFMGMGEPLDNYDNVIKAVRIMNDPKGLGIGARKITISTCGVVPGIERLEKLGLQVELSVSLHATDDELRDELVPANRKYPLKELERVLAGYFESTGRVVTLEYTLIKDVNDGDKDAERLAAFAKKIKAKVNLIACNPLVMKGREALAPGRIETFRAILMRKSVTATIRRSKGDDIMAACGQLAARKKQTKS